MVLSQNILFGLSRWPKAKFPVPSLGKDTCIYIGLVFLILQWREVVTHVGKRVDCSSLKNLCNFFLSYNKGSCDTCRKKSRLLFLEESMWWSANMISNSTCIQAWFPSQIFRRGRPFKTWSMIVKSHLTILISIPTYVPSQLFSLPIWMNHTPPSPFPITFNTKHRHLQLKGLELMGPTQPRFTFSPPLAPLPLVTSSNLSSLTIREMTMVS